MDRNTCTPQPTVAIPTHALVSRRSASLPRVAVVLSSDAQAQIMPPTIETVMISVINVNSRMGHTHNVAVEQ